MDFKAILLNWYRQHHRDLPWRNTRNPYHIWLSEVILQQTRVDQGLKYYLSFTENFPEISDLALAPEEKVLKLWQGLGYYSRALNLHAAARFIWKEKKGVFPRTYSEIRELKGVGDYTAAAVSSICFGEAKPVIDGNVYRVLSRVFGVEEAIDSTKGKKIFRELAESLLDHSDPGTYNQSVMEFGALHCTPRNPSCDSCPLLGFCIAQKKNLVQQLPRKEKKTKQRPRYFYYMVMKEGENTWFRKRMGKDIWNGLYDFPMIESEKPMTEEELLAHPFWKQMLRGIPHQPPRFSAEYKHVLSHQLLFIRFAEIRLQKSLPAVRTAALEKAGKKKAEKLALPIVIARYREEKGK